MDAHQNEGLRVRKIAGKDQPADSLTKALPPREFQKLTKSMFGIEDNGLFLAQVPAVRGERIKLSSES